MGSFSHMEKKNIKIRAVLLLRPAETLGQLQPREHGWVMHDTRNIFDLTTKIR
jgi:hypothetical protein